MNDPSPEKLKDAVQALYRARAVEGPPGDHGHRSVWHMGTQGAELLSLVDSEGRVQRQELTLLDDHYVWSSGEGLRTGWVVREGGARGAVTNTRTDPQLVPFRLIRGAVALADYEGEDRYILHMKRMLALAREGVEMREASVSRPLSPKAGAAAQAGPSSPVGRMETPSSSPYEGLVMLGVFGVGLIAGIALLFWLL